MRNHTEHILLAIEDVAQRKRLMDEMIRSNQELQSFTYVEVNPNRWTKFGVKEGRQSDQRDTTVHPDQASAGDHNRCVARDLNPQVPADAVTAAQGLTPRRSLGICSIGGTDTAGHELR